MKSHPEPVVNFESNSKSVKSNRRFRSKKYQIDNRQKCIDCLKPRPNKNELVCKKCRCDYCAQLLKFFICCIFHFVVYKNDSIAKD